MSRRLLQHAAEEVGPTFLGCVVMGAPINPETLLMSIALASVLGVTPQALYHDERALSAPEESSRGSPRNRGFGPWHRTAIFVAVLLGSAAAPLDWEVWWQRWPIPSALLAAVAATLSFVHITLA